MSISVSSVSDLNQKVTITIINEGTGRKPKTGELIKVHYTGKLEDGTEFDSSHKHGAPFEFHVGVGMVIQGWDQALLQMRVGEKALLHIPAELAYGPSGVPGLIPSNAPLLFEVELLEILHEA